MNTDQQRGDQDEPLCSVLGEWRVETPLPPRFQDQVWQRIARAEARPASNFRAGVCRVLEVVLPRPGIAFSYMAALLILGVAAGSVTAQVKNDHLNTALSERYVQSIDPYRAEIPQP